MKIIIILLTLTCIILISSCSEDATSPTIDKYIPGDLTYMMLLPIPDSIKHENIIEMMKISTTRSMYLFSASINLYRVSSGTNAYGLFLKDGKWVESGKYEVNGDNIHTYLLDSSSSNSQIGYNRNYESMMFGGNLYKFQHYGNNYFPPIIFNIIAPDSMVNVEYPLEDDTISQKSDLTIKWNSDRSTVGKYVRIRISSDPTYIDRPKGYAITYHINQWYFTTDNGSYTIPKEKLAEHKPGRIFLDIDAGNCEMKEIMPGKYGYAAVYSTFWIDCYLRK
ncbi:MAG: hypothetical protein HW421_2168 [Ignavibacteria bacterium]|nr:hypothetical protein [Ignavibacteria bacterium]